MSGAGLLLSRILLNQVISCQGLVEVEKEAWASPKKHTQPTMSRQGAQAVGEQHVYVDCKNVLTTESFGQLKMHLRDQVDTEAHASPLYTVTFTNTACCSSYISYISSLFISSQTHTNILPH